MRYHRRKKLFKEFQSVPVKDHYGDLSVGHRSFLLRKETHITPLDLVSDDSFSNAGVSTTRLPVVG